MARAALVPLAELIDRKMGIMDTSYPMPVPYTEPFEISFFVAGRPKAKDRGTPMTNKAGKSFIFTSKEVKEKEAYVREEFMANVHLRYPEFKQFLPITGGWTWMEIYFLLPPPEKLWYPGKPHVGAPDTDNLFKLVKDALSGRASGKPPLAFKDDSMNAGASPVWKLYWDPTRIDEDGYPGSPGTLVVIHFEVTPRDPSLLPPGKAICYTCGRDDFVSERALTAHERKCNKNG